MQDTFELKKLHDDDDGDDNWKVFCTREHSIQCSFTYSPSFVLVSSPVYSFVWWLALFAPLRRDTRPFTSRVARQQQRNDEMKRYKPKTKQRNETKRDETTRGNETQTRDKNDTDENREKRNKESQRSIFKSTTRWINKAKQLETEQRETQGECDKEYQML